MGLIEFAEAAALVLEVKALSRSQHSDVAHERDLLELALSKVRLYYIIVFYLYVFSE